MALLLANDRDHLLNEKVPMKNLPSLPDLVREFGERKGTLSIREKDYQYSLFDKANYSNDQFGLQLSTTGEYKGDNNAEFRYRVIFDAKGKFIEGHIFIQYRREDGTYVADTETLDEKRAQGVLSHTRPLAMELKEKMDQLPRIPTKLDWLQNPGFNKFVRTLSKEELKNEAMVLLDPEKQKSPSNFLPPHIPVPSKYDKNINIHTGACTVVVERSNSWRASYAPYGVLIMYFPGLDTDSKRNSFEKDHFNTYSDAVIFPYSFPSNNSAEIAGHWEAAYQMIRRGKSSKEVYAELKRRAEMVENRFRQEMRTYNR